MNPPRQHQQYTEQEIAILRRWAGVKTAAEIATMLGRSVRSVGYKLRDLGLSGQLYGEHHWSAKYADLLIAMVLTLYDAGFTPAEIYNTLSRAELDHKAIKNIIHRRKA